MLTAHMLGGFSLRDEKGRDVRAGSVARADEPTVGSTMAEA
jgi:hypothetical protein